MVLMEGLLDENQARILLRSLLPRALPEFKVIAIDLREQLPKTSVCDNIVVYEFAANVVHDVTVGGGEPCAAQIV